MPRLLTVDHKRNRVTISKQCLEMFQRNPNEFLRQFITVDEIWIHYFTPETKEQSKQWISSGELGTLKKAKTIKSVGKVIAIVFWDARGIFISITFRSKRLIAIISQPY